MHMIERWQKKLSIAAFTMMLLLAATQPGAAQMKSANSRVERLRPLFTLIGDWELRTRMIPLKGTIREETGTMNCTCLYDSTYIQCDVSLTGYDARKRAYKTFITWEPDSSRFVQLYLYSDSPVRIIEWGEYKQGTFRTTTSFTNYLGKAETIHTLLTIKDINNMVFESRSSLTNGDVDYECWYKRKEH